MLLRPHLQWSISGCLPNVISYTLISHTTNLHSSLCNFHCHYHKGQSLYPQKHRADDELGRSVSKWPGKMDPFKHVATLNAFWRSDRALIHPLTCIFRSPQNTFIFLSHLKAVASFVTCQRFFYDSVLWHSDRNETPTDTKQFNAP